MGLWIDIKRGWLLLVTNRNIRWTMRRFLLWSVRWLQNELLFRLLLHKVARFIILMSNTSFSMVILKRKFTWHYLLIWSSTLPRMSVSWSAHYMDWNKLLKLGLTNFTPPCFSFLFSKACLLFLCKTSTGVVLLLVYVDDIIIIVMDSVLITHFKQHLQASFHMKDLGLLAYFLGLEVHINPSSIFLNQYNICGIWLLWHVFRIPPLWILLLRLTWNIIVRKATSLILPCFVN